MDPISETSARTSQSRSRSSKASLQALALLVGSTLLFTPSHADVGQHAGLSALELGYGGATPLAPNPATGAMANPASLALPPTETSVPWKLSFGVTYLGPHFDPIEGVTVENTYTSDQTRSGKVDTVYKGVLGQTVGLTFPVVGQIGLGGGLALYLPLDSLAGIDTGETFLPEYVLYRTRLLRPEIHAGLGYTLNETWSVGAGIKLGFSATTRSTMFLKTTSGQPTQLRFAATVKPRATPEFGAIARFADFPVGLTIRAPLRSTTTLDIDATAEALGGLAGLDYTLSAQTPLAYDPWMIELSTKTTLFGIDVEPMLSYERWSDFVRPAVEVNSTRTKNGTLISGSAFPILALQDIVVPRLSLGVALGDWQLRMGYRYRASIFKYPPNDSGNLLSPPEHQLSLGGSTALKPGLFLDASLKATALVGQTIAKSAGNEAGNLSDTKIGAPGYTAGGVVWGFGLGIRTEF